MLSFDSLSTHKTSLKYCIVVKHAAIMSSMLISAFLTLRQNQVLEFIQDCIRETGLIPTQQEIAAHFGFKSPNSVRQHLRLIEQKGFLRRIRGRSRALVLEKQVVVAHSNSASTIEQNLEEPIPGRQERGRGNLSTRKSRINGQRIQTRARLLRAAYDVMSAKGPSDYGMFAREPFPVQLESDAMPTDNRLRPHDDG